MTTKKPTGGPAFPQSQTPTEREFISGLDVGEGGMTLRDYFAAHASDEDVRHQAEILRAKMLRDIGVGILPDCWPATAKYMHADAMLKAREQ